MGNHQQATLADYIEVLRRRKWIVVIAVLLTTASAIAYSSQQAKRFQSSAQVFVNPTAQGGSVGPADVQARFLSTDAKLVHTPPVAAAAIRTAQVSGVTVPELLAQSAVTPDSTTNILTVTVADPVGSRAEMLANAYALAVSDETKRLVVLSVDGAIQKLQRSIRQLNSQISAAEKTGFVPPSLRQRLNQSLRQLDREQQIKLTQPVAAAVSQRAAGATQTQPKIARDALIGFALGIVIGIGLAFIREALDDRVQSTEEIQRAVGAGLLARVNQPPRKLRSTNQIVMLADPSHATAEQYRKLRIALDFANIDVRGKTVLVTSALEQEGKSTTAANLAVAMAHAGRHVTLVDLDIRRPQLHTLFGLPAGPGIVDVAMGHSTLGEAMRRIVLVSEGSMPLPVSNGNGAVPATTLQFLPVGTLPPDPASFIETAALLSVLSELKDRSDLVIIDSAPLVPVSDSVALAGRVDAALLVAQPAILTRNILTELGRLLRSSHVRTLGFVLAGSDVERGYGYRYGYGYPTANPEDPQLAAPAIQRTSEG